MDGAQRPMTATLEGCDCHAPPFFLKFYHLCVYDENYGAWFCLFLSVIKMTVKS